ncbi:tyrosine-type recombinase/integrase [Streptomyces sp. RKAG337]|uniref:tyrosine-type recombinase/integrase n=1 Tax=Streptomyces sp. RKAG337 TaxID=2893404 RepID=UPI002034A2A8|nr:tyrosine-type recombinase/integrase [Streptomyces sp. RKAG337]MCM2427345.1 tyrosine-type recombinase/integrase [Streptomyces sp. RKAG337]
MARRASNNPRQIRSKTCGCPLCKVEYPPEQHGARKARRDCLGSWQARYRNPAGEQKSRNFDKKGDADAFLDEVRTAVRQRKYHDPKRGEILVSAWWEEWWPTQEKKGKTTTRNRKLSSWNAHINKRWGTTPLNGIQYLALQNWLTNEVKGHATQTKVLELMRHFLRDAVRDGRLQGNPAADVEVTATVVPKHPDDLKPPTLEQYEAIRRELPVYYRVIADFAQDTGMRWGEYTALRMCNVDLDAGLVYVREVVIDDHGKLRRQAIPKSAAGLRTVPLTPKALDALKAMLDRWAPKATVTEIGDGTDMVPEELVLRGPLGGVLNRNNFRRVWIPAIKAAGVARLVKNPETGRNEWWPRVHDYRHGVASRLHAAGIPEVDVQLFLGQERGGRTTWLYTHGSDEALGTARNALTPGVKLRVVPSGDTTGAGVHKGSTIPPRRLSEALGDSGPDEATAV